MWPTRLTWLGVGAMASLLGAVALTALLLDTFPGTEGDVGVRRSPTEVISLESNGSGPSSERRRESPEAGRQTGPSGPLPAPGGSPPPGGGAPLNNPTVVQYGDSLRRIEASLATSASTGGTSSPNGRSSSSPD